jgi:hypothetical protein
MERAEQVTHQIEQALERVQHDPFSTYETYADMQALQRNMTHLQNTLMPQLQQSLQALHPESPLPAQLQQPKQQLEAAVQELERLSSRSILPVAKSSMMWRSSATSSWISKTSSWQRWIICQRFSGGNVPGAQKCSIPAIAHAGSHASHGTLP